MISTKIRKIFGKANVIEPIYDPFVYEKNKESTAGNALQGSNVLIVTNLPLEDKECAEIKKRLECEQTDFRMIHTSNNVTLQQIFDAGKKLVGPFEHIINVFSFGEEKLGVTVDVKMLYQSLQCESEYLVEHAHKGTLCSVMIFGGDKIAAQTGSALVSGMGSVMGNHSIISNGVMASREVPFAHVMATAAYLSSKYGQILSGEVIHMEA